MFSIKFPAIVCVSWHKTGPHETRRSSKSAVGQLKALLQSKWGNAHRSPGKVTKERAQDYGWDRAHERGTPVTSVLCGMKQNRKVSLKTSYANFSRFQEEQRRDQAPVRLPEYASDLLMGFSVYFKSSCVCHDSFDI